MLVHELSAADCGDVLARVNFGRLACSRNDQPYIVPINFSFDAERNCLYAFSAVGQKIEWMRVNPKVCLEVEEIGDAERWTTVLAFGRYDELKDTPDDTETRQRALLRFQERSSWWFPAAAKLPDREHHAIVVYRINIDRLTGRRTSRSR